tara:strand:- start:929 stop:1435 length:507 start_codon:yes stop_codon:yes gene_type:complete
MVLEKREGVCYVIYMTPKMEKFASLLASDDPPTLVQAYEKAGYTVKKTSTGAYKSDIHVRASELAQHPKVIEKVTELKELREKRLSAQKIQALSKDEQLRDQIEKQLKVHAFDDEENPAVKVKYLQLLGQSVAMFTDRVVTKEESLTEEELEAEIKRDLATWYPDTKQ